MARSKGSLSTDEAKSMCAELEQLCDKPFKYNFNYLRLIELLVCQRVVEQLCKYSEDTPTYNLRTRVEIPLIGTLNITPKVSIENRKKNGGESFHLDFDFTPTSGFKTDILKAYSEKLSDLPDVFANIYGERLQELYKNLKGGE